MHVSEGLLPDSHAALYWLAALPLLALGTRAITRLRKANPLYFTMVGMFGAAVFVLSAFPVPVPVAGTCSHPAGTGLSAIFLGPLPSIVVAFVSLLIQALIMAHGGLTTLGANTLTMGVIGSLSAYGAYRMMRCAGCSPFVAGFAAGAVADITTYAATAAVLTVSVGGGTLRDFAEIALAFLPTQGPLTILEGFITGYAVRYVNAHRPDLLDACRTMAPSTEIPRES